MTVRTPGTPASKSERATPTQTPASTPGGPKPREEKIVVTVRLRPLNKREQLAKDQVAWDCVDDHTIVYKPQPHERVAQPSSFTFGNFLIIISFISFFEIKNFINLLIFNFFNFFFMQIKCLVLLV